MRNVVQLCFAANNILLMRKRNHASPSCDRSCVKKGRWLCFPKVVVKKNKLGGRMIKQFLIRLSQNIAICQSLAHQLFCRSLRLRQIIDLLATDKLRYFAQLRPIILFTAHLKQRKQTSLTMNLTLTMVHKTKKTNQWIILHRGWPRLWPARPSVGE